MIKFKVTFTVLFICFCLTSFSGHNKRNETIGEINRNCNVPFALTLPESSLENIKEYSMIGGFGSYLLENEDVSVTISGYPDCLDKYHITGYQIKTPKYIFMGLQVGCSLEAIGKVMNLKGFMISTESSRWREYIKNGVRIGISLKDKAVTIFHISVDVTNKKDVSF